jgi:hypothetical protein
MSSAMAFESENQIGRIKAWLAYLLIAMARPALLGALLITWLLILLAWLVVDTVHEIPTFLADGGLRLAMAAMIGAGLILGDELRRFNRTRLSLLLPSFRIPAGLAALMILLGTSIVLLPLTPEPGVGWAILAASGALALSAAVLVNWAGGLLLVLLILVAPLIVSPELHAQLKSPAVTGLSILLCLFALWVWSRPNIRPPNRPSLSRFRKLWTWHSVLHWPAMGLLMGMLLAVVLPWMITGRAPMDRHWIHGLGLLMVFPLMGLSNLAGMELYRARSTLRRLSVLPGGSRPALFHWVQTSLLLVAGVYLLVVFFSLAFGLALGVYRTDQAAMFLVIWLSAAMIQIPAGLWLAVQHSFSDVMFGVLGLGLVIMTPVLIVFLAVTDVSLNGSGLIALAGLALLLSMWLWHAARRAWLQSSLTRVAKSH